MTAHAHVDLGPDFDARWQHAPLALRRELMAELRDLYRFLEEDDDIPVLASAPATPAKPQPKQPGLFDAPAERPALTPRQDNPFLPRSVLERLQHSQTQAGLQLQELARSTEQPMDVRHMEQELRLRLGPIVETLVEEHLQGLKAELRFRLRGEMEKLIADATRKR